MDDLSGLDWSNPDGGRPKPPPPMNPPSFPSMRPTPSPLASGRSTPLSSQASTGPPPKTAAAKPSHDSFSNLVHFGSAKAGQHLTLAERQAQLEAEKRKRDEERRRQAESQFGTGQQWDALGSRTFTPSPALKAPDDDDDLFAAFNKDTKVDNASHYPPPDSDRSTPANGTRLNLSDPSAWNSTAGLDSGPPLAADDDDPFGLNELKPTAGPPAPAPAGGHDDDDDFLGDLGKPIEEVRKMRQDASRPAPGKPIEIDDSSSSSDDEPQPRRQAPDRKAGGDADAFDRALAQLVDYGFSPDDARRGLMQSGSGNNVQAAANWLLDDAHRKAKQNSRESGSAAAHEVDPRTGAARGDVDFTKSAAAMGNSLFKTANSLWKTGQKKMQQAVADFQQEGDPSQPKWMRDSQSGRAQGRSGGPGAAHATDEALALDSSSSSNSRHAGSRLRCRPTRGQDSTD
ncbi:hypothetical protein CDD83_782 [Cordyceps sp. RAO-2017]|nr:hypothetical protein CDD83_782 [Cordyceps sp. RAO-2017]